MSHTKIAIPRKFDEGAPVINLPSIIGASPNRPFLQKIPILGARPLKIEITPCLPEGLSLDEHNGTISGFVAQKGNYEISIKVSNCMGSTQKKLTIEIEEDHILLTPLLGWTSWNAHTTKISQDIVLKTAQYFVDQGLIEYGYTYINIDSTWQGEYGGKYFAIQPNGKFPDMKGMCEKIHSLGLKCGIYSTPMKRAYGSASADIILPGCTMGERDMAFPDTMTGIGVDHYEENNVRQWTEWGFDYLKYDWYYCDPINASLMKNCLLKSERDFGFCVTVYADIAYAEDWKKMCCSWRDTTDSIDKWEIVKKIFLTADKWADHISKGHYFDLDMLEIGYMSIDKDHYCQLSEDEQIFVYSFRALLPSPIQISCQVDKINEFELALCCNEEIIAINQDALCKPALLEDESRCEETGKHIKVYRKMLENDAVTIGVFNFGETAEQVTYPLQAGTIARDLWLKQDLSYDGPICLDMQPHTARMIKIGKTLGGANNNEK